VYCRKNVNHLLLYSKFSECDKKILNRDKNLLSSRLDLKNLWDTNTNNICYILIFHVHNLLTKFPFRIEQSLCAWNVFSWTLTINFKNQLKLKYCSLMRMRAQVYGCMLLWPRHYLLRESNVVMSVTFRDLCGHFCLDLLSLDVYFDHTVFDIVFCWSFFIRIFFVSTIFFWHFRG